MLCMILKKASFKTQMKYMSSQLWSESILVQITFDPCFKQIIKLIQLTKEDFQIPLIQQQGKNHKIFALAINLCLHIIYMQSENIIIREQIVSSPHFEGKVTITVEEPIKNETETFPFFTYNVVGSDANGPFSVRRRYRNFDLLRTKLSQRWLGIYIPPISGKRSESNFLSAFKKLQSKHNNSELRHAEIRKRFLKYFCEGVAARPYLYHCDLFQTFLRGATDFQVAIKCCLQKEYSFLLAEYEKHFKTLGQISDFTAALTTSEENYRELKQSQEKLVVIYQAIVKSVCARNEFNEQFNVCMTTAFPQYQEKIFLNHVGKDRKKLVFGKGEQFGAKVEQYKVVSSVIPQETLLQLVAYEIRETKAFIEAIKGRREAQKRREALKQSILNKTKQMHNLTKGGFSFNSLFKSGSKDLQIKELQIKIQIRKNELQCLQKMIVFMVANTNYELSQFKRRRGKSYSDLLKSAAEKQLNEINLYNQLLNLLQVQA